MPETPPGFWPWVRYVLREWNPRDLKPQERSSVQRMALLMATHSPNGERIYVSAAELSRLTGYGERTIKRIRRRAIKAGLFAETGELKFQVPVLTIAIPKGCHLKHPPGTTGPGGVSSEAPPNGWGVSSEAPRGVICDTQYIDVDIEKDRDEGVSSETPHNASDKDDLASFADFVQADDLASPPHVQTPAEVSRTTAEVVTSSLTDSMSADDLETNDCGDLAHPCKSCRACEAHRRHLRTATSEPYRRLVNKTCIWCQSPWKPGR